MKKVIAISLLALLCLSLAGSATASTADTVNVIVVFKSPVTTQDVQYLEALGGVVKYTFTIIDGVAVSLPQAALSKLQCLQANPGTDPVAGNIKYIENDGEVHAMGGPALAVEPSQPMKISAKPAAPVSASDLLAGASNLLKGSFGLLPFGNFHI